jgi:hypothetical protein
VCQLLQLLLQLHRSHAADGLVAGQQLVHQDTARGPRVLRLVLVRLVLVGSRSKGMPLTPDLIGYLSCLQHAHQQALDSAVCWWWLTT